MTVTVLYPEERQIPDDGLEREIFGPEIRIMRRTVKTVAELDPADCAELDGLMIMRYAVTAEDIDRFPRLRAIVRMGVGYDKIARPAAAARNVLVCNVPDYGTTEVADHAIALACGQARKDVRLLRRPCGERLRLRSPRSFQTLQCFDATRPTRNTLHQMRILVPLGSKNGIGTILAPIGPASLVRVSWSPSLPY